MTFNDFTALVSNATAPRPGLIEEDYPLVVVDEEFLAWFVDNHQWKFASTMAGCPHWYVVREKIPKESDFLRFVHQIRAFGYDSRWFQLTNRYLDFNGFKYWTMGFVESVTIIINRAHLEEPARKFSPAPQKFYAKPPTK
jgi:hypothetical protein